MNNAFRMFCLIGALPASLSFAQDRHRSPVWAGSLSASLVAPADSRTATSIGGEIEIDRSVSSSFSVGVIAGLWVGDTDLDAGTFGDQDSSERYLALIGTYRGSGRRVRPFAQLGGGLYVLEFNFISRNRFAPRDRETRGGALGGIGLEYALSGSALLRGGVRYHLVGDASGVHPDFFQGHLGLGFLF